MNELENQFKKVVGIDFMRVNWVRKRYSGRIEERPPKIDDLKAFGVNEDGVNFSQYNPEEENAWKKDNPNYTKVLDKYIMRRVVENITAVNEVNPASFQQTEMRALLTEEDLHTDEEIEIAGADMPMVLEDDWYLVEIDCEDQNGKSIITGKFRRYGRWKAVKVINN